MRKNFGSKPYIFPEPVLIITTYNEDNSANAMNAAWGGICDYDKLFVSLGKHKTTDNIYRNKDFCICIPTLDYVKESDYVGIVSGYKVENKLESIGLNTIKSEFVNAPIIKEFPICIECSYIEENEYGLIGKIVNVSVDESILDDSGNVDPSKMNTIVFDSLSKSYFGVKDKVGDAFKDGKKLIK